MKGMTLEAVTQAVGGVYTGPFGYATVQRERIVSRFGGCELQKPRQ